MVQNAFPQPNPNEKLVRIFDTEQESEALVVRGLLQSAGIDCQLGESENSTDVLPVGAIGLLVREEDAEQAREIIEEYRRTPQQEQAEEADFEEAAVDGQHDLSEDTSEQ
jgi:Putative prokaryotic signal transducing protein